jgi:hypothetical protein
VLIKGSDATRPNLGSQLNTMGNCIWQLCGDVNVARQRKVHLLNGSMRLSSHLNLALGISMLRVIHHVLNGLNTSTALLVPTSLHRNAMLIPPTQSMLKPSLGIAMGTHRQLVILKGDKTALLKVRPVSQEAIPPEAR